MNYKGVEMFQISPAEPVESSGPKLEETLIDPNPSGERNFDKSSLPKFLQKIGIDPAGLSLTEIGKAQLVGRLEKKFGPEYKNITQALEALSLFDKEIQKFPMDTKKTLTKVVSSGERTLAELLKR